jgi:hypothetical protein
MQRDTLPAPLAVPLLGRLLRQRTILYLQTLDTVLSAAMGKAPAAQLNTVYKRTTAAARPACTICIDWRAVSPTHWQYTPNPPCTMLICKPQLERGRQLAAHCCAQHLHYVTRNAYR